MKMHLNEKRQEVKGVATFIFEPEEELSWQPGQYLHYVLEHNNPDDRGVERWFTISAAPFETNPSITTRVDGEKMSSFKNALINMEPGDQIEADGPKGSFVFQEGEHQHVFISGGIGITPFRSMLAQLARDNQDKKITLLYANRDSNFVYGNELKSIQTLLPSFQIREFIDKRIELADFEEFFADKSSIYYLSGPRSMVEAYESLLSDNGVDKTAIMTDYFPGY